jgi:hypothetical protein
MSKRTKTIITPWLDCIVEYHSHYVSLNDTEAPKSMKELIKIILEKQTTSKNLCLNCGCDMGQNWYSQLCSRVCMTLNFDD